MDSQKPDVPVKNVNPLLPVVESFFEKEASTGVSILENVTDDQAEVIAVYPHGVFFDDVF